MADVSLELLAANQRKIMQKLEDLDDIKAMLRLLRDTVEIGNPERSIFDSRLAKLEKRISRLEEQTGSI